MKHSSLSPDNTSYVVAILVIATAYFLFALWTPLQREDMVFLAQTLDPSTGSFSLAGLCNHFMVNWIDDNSRLLNLLAPIGPALLPHWAMALITGTATALMLALAERLTRPTSRSASPAGNTAALTTMWLASMIAWPWRDRMMVWCYSLNYIAAMVLVLAFLILLLKWGTRSGTPSKAAVVGGICLAIAAGWAHNGISAPLLAALGAWALTKRLRLTPRQWSLCIAFLAGTILAHISPAIWMRAQVESTRMSLAEAIKASITILPLAWMLMAALVAVLAVPRWRRAQRNLLSNDQFRIAVMFTIFASAMTMLLEIQPRYGWAPEIMASVALWQLVRNIPVATSPRACNLITAISLLLTIIPMQAVLRTQHTLWVEHTVIADEIAASPDGTVFRDVIGKDDVPTLTLRQTSAGLWKHAYQMAYHNALYLHTSRMAAVVPSALADFSFNNAQPVDSTGKLFTHKGILISADTIAPFSHGASWQQGRQQVAVRKVRLAYNNGDSTTWEANIFKFNTACEPRTTAVYFGEMPEPFRSTPPERVEFLP